MTSTEVSRRTNSDNNFVLPMNPTQDDWYHSIEVALMKLKIIPSDLHDFDPVIAGIPLSERQSKCIDEFWYGLDHLLPTEKPIAKLVKKVLQLPPTSTPLDTKHRAPIEVRFNGYQEYLYISLGYQIALSLKSPFFNTFFQTQQPYRLDCDRKAFTEMLKVVCANKKVDLKQAPTLLPLAIKFQLEVLEQMFINETIRALNALFAETNSATTTHLEKIFGFLRILETEYGWRPLPDEIIKNLRNHASQYKLNFGTYRYIDNCAMLLDECPTRRPQLRNFLSSCLYNNQKMWPAVSMWETLQRLNSSELAVKGPNVDEFKEILKISALKKLVIFEYKQLIFHTENSHSDNDEDLWVNESITENSDLDDNEDLWVNESITENSDLDDNEDLWVNVSITEFSVTIDRLSSLPLDIVRLLPNVQMFELSNSVHPNKDSPYTYIYVGSYISRFIEWKALQTLKFKDLRVNCEALLNMNDHPNLKEIVFTNCHSVFTSFQELTNKLSPKIKITIN